MFPLVFSQQLVTLLASSISNGTCFLDLFGPNNDTHISTPSHRRSDKDGNRHQVEDQNEYYRHDGKMGS
jgi:hypothetical protein